MRQQTRKRLPKPPLKGVKVKGNKRWLAKRQERQQERHRESEPGNKRSD
jgi:hypothetical protein